MKRVLSVSLFTLLLGACGYKGKLYLPQPNDKAQFGAIQTGTYLKQPDAKHQSNYPSQTTPSQSK